ncbi:peroxisomal membrane protein PEX16 [Sitophilus oryzae]|uniref:Peroxisomal membrane protein PEX16 n=1 Tax=Sitophilus oryzae TaxID=7048 RepID=A0A6J2XX65_SITOR|nr:peroxisomal membrane protein PEX16 [Sitophilus oryzae]
MSGILITLPELFNSYKSWVKHNPQLASDYETTVKWLSYFLAGRVHNSHVVSELVYCLSNLVVLFNDRIIRKSFGEGSTAVEKIKLWLTVVEYSEVFCELSFQKLWGKTGKWFIIVVIQIFKCVARFLLVHKYKEVIIETPPIPPLDRTKTTLKGGSSDSNNVADLSLSTSFTLKHSGRAIRKIDASPPLPLRTWKALEPEIIRRDLGNEFNRIVINRQLIAEYIYITKPLVHLASAGVFGTRSWKPWMIALGFDTVSLSLYKSTQKLSSGSLTKAQKIQLSKRVLLLILYLLRSPFYEKCSENRINAFLNALINNVPLARIVCTPLLQYLPFWQNNYFHMWST